MDDGVELAAIKPRHQVGGRHDIGELSLGQVAPARIRAFAEPVVDDDVGPAGLVQAGDDIRADEPGAAGDEQHALSFCPKCFA